MMKLSVDGNVLSLLPIGLDKEEKEKDYCESFRKKLKESEFKRCLEIRTDENPARFQIHSGRRKSVPISPTSLVADSANRDLIRVIGRVAALLVPHPNDVGC